MVNGINIIIIVIIIIIIIITMMIMKINNNIISVRLGSAYFAEIENFLLKVL